MSIPELSNPTSTSTLIALQYKKREHSTVTKGRSCTYLQQIGSSGDPPFSAMSRPRHSRYWPAPREECRQERALAQGFAMLTPRREECHRGRAWLGLAVALVTRRCASGFTFEGLCGTGTNKCLCQRATALAAFPSALLLKCQV